MASRELRAMTYSDYGISKYRYRELRALCQQYPEMKRKIQYGLRAVVNDGMPHSTDVGRPTEQAALNNLRFSWCTGIIEESAKEATDGYPAEVYRAILKNVTEGTAVMYLPPIPICEADFYALRRLFYHYLDKKNVIFPKRDKI